MQEPWLPPSEPPLVPCRPPPPPRRPTWCPWMAHIGSTAPAPPRNGLAVQPGLPSPALAASTFGVGRGNLRLQRFPFVQGRRGRSRRTCDRAEFLPDGLVIERGVTRPSLPGPAGGVPAAPFLRLALCHRRPGFFLRGCRTDRHRGIHRRHCHHERRELQRRARRRAATLCAVAFRV